MFNRVPGLVSFSKMTVTQRRSRAWTAPTPTKRKELNMMLALCAGEFMKAVCREDTVLPMPTFSPSMFQRVTLRPRVVELV